MAAPVPLRRNRDFLYLWSGQAVSVLGSQMSRVAYPLLVLAITGSAVKAGFASAAATLPYLLFPLLAGAYADRHDRHRIMIACDILRLAALCGVAIAAATGRAAYPVVLVAGFAEGTGTAFYNIADRGAIPMLVHESQRATALAQNEARSYGAQLAGPALGGALFGLSRFLPFAADAFSYMGSLFTLAMIRKPMQEARPEEPKQLARELTEGLRLTLRQPFLRAASVLAAVVNLSLQMLSLAIIVLARGDGASPALTGAIVACMGAGGLGGAFAAPWLQRHIRPGLIITGCVWSWAVLIALVAVVRSPVWLCPVTTMIGVAGSPWNVAVQTYRLRIVPNHMLARVSSVTFQIAWGAIPLGSLLAAALLGSMSATRVAVIISVVLAVTAAAATVSASVRGAGGTADRGLVPSPKT
jgi:MFS family permease